ncbi:MAG: glycoside hydrolase family 57 protein [Desulfovibrionales bacterium]|nr:glycoside hydrolase family 57 protein [Desulfovibrionales bacterium]
MHQPNYKDPLRGRYSMPWVRLHGIKAYHDMPSLLSNFSSIKQTFNLVPSLLVQLQDYASGQAKDDFLDISAKPAGELTSEDREFILSNFFNCNWETMIKPYPRFWQLLLKRGMVIDESRVRESVARFNTQDFLDLQIWFNLTWFGYTSRKKPDIYGLFRKGQFFSERDKGIVLDTQQEVIKEIIPLYARLAEKKQIEITTSPFYHPILPLLIDSDFAGRPIPEVRLPQRFQYPEDAFWHLSEAMSLHEKIFGQRPRGLWPSEGSVCPELIPIMSELGIKWAATDEGILFHSLARQGESSTGNYNRDTLFYPYAVEHEGAKVNMVFRDHGLSDLFGFVYYRNQPHQAAEDFFSHLHNIRNNWQSGKKPLLLNIILDGENPWEHYSDGGETFLTEIYKSFSNSSDFKTTTVSDYLEEFPPTGSIAHLYTGSWINHNFDIWIGGVEENEGWDILGQTRSFLARSLEERRDLSDEAVSKAWESLHAAEGSDWFWWYGEHFSCAYSFEFDRLFREYLSQVYRAMGEEVPERLKSPIKRLKKVIPPIEPKGFIHPVLDGRLTQFYEWSGAGYFETKTTGGAMYQGREKITAIYYGFNVDNLCFRLETDEADFSGWSQDQEIYLYLLNSRPYFLTVFPAAKGDGFYYRLYKGRPDDHVLVDEFNSIGIYKFVELAVSFKYLGFNVGEEIRLVVEVRDKGLVKERYPSVGYLAIIVPDENFEQIHWQV